MKLQSITLLGAMLSLSIGAPAPAQVTEVRLRVDGMACPFCAYNMEKRIKTLDGYIPKSAVETNLEKGVTVTSWNKEERFEPQAVSRAAKESGFTLRSISLTAAGALPAEVQPNADSITLTAKGTDQAIQLAPKERADRAASWASLIVYASGEGAGEAVVVDGEVIEEGGGWRVLLHRWSPSEFGAKVRMRIAGFTCEGCSAGAMRALLEAPGVIHAEADHERGEATVWTRSETPDLDGLRERVGALGFTVTHMHEGATR